MTYKCDDCGAIFYEPDTKHHRENLDGENGVWEYDYSVCPRCGSNMIYTMKDGEDDARM